MSNHDVAVLAHILFMYDAFMPSEKSESFFTYMDAHNIYGRMKILCPSVHGTRIVSRASNKLKQRHTFHTLILILILNTD
jgi:hypothetical protein